MKLFTGKDLAEQNKDKKAAHKRLKKYLNVKSILWVNRIDFVIYITAFIVSIISIIPYFFADDTLQTVLMSFGCSLLGAVLLAYFLALRSERTRLAVEAQNHNKILFRIYGLIYSICSNQNPNIATGNINNAMLPFLKGRENLVKKVLNELEVAISEYLGKYGNYIDEELYDYLCKLNNQIVEFENNCARIDSVGCAQAMYTFFIVGIPKWFEENFNEEFILKHYIE